MIHLNPNCSEYTFRIKIEGQDKDKLDKFIKIINYIEKQTELGIDNEHITTDLNTKYDLGIEGVDNEVSCYKDKVFGIEHYKISGYCDDMGEWLSDILNNLKLEYEEEEQ